VWLFLFGSFRACIKTLPAFIVVGGLFGVIAYFAYGSDISASIAMVNRFGAIFLAGIIGCSVEAVAICRSLSELHTPRSITLGMLIATSFVPVLRLEIKRVREAMKTRGAGSVLNPKVFYRAFLVPLVMRLVGISDTLSLSVETRGFTLDKANYTVYKRETVAISDIVFLLAIVVGGVLVVVL
jgi:energy-coupling factor transport system permease protein